jgi:hypothetical protein
MLIKVISGFQTGSDFAGVRAAKDCGIETGGYMPKGFKTLDGPKPEYVKLYGAVEHSSSNYAHRTWDNVKISDATIRFASNWISAGEKCTHNAIKNWGKPHLDFKVSDHISYLNLTTNESKLYLLDWLRVHDIKILNIAGNSEQTSPGIEKIVYDFLRKVF